MLVRGNQGMNSLALAPFSWWPRAATSWAEFGTQAIHWQNNTQAESEESRVINYFGKTPPPQAIISSKPSFHPFGHNQAESWEKQQHEQQGYKKHSHPSLNQLPRNSLGVLDGHSLSLLEQQVSCFPVHPALLICIILV